MQTARTTSGAVAAAAIIAGALTVACTHSLAVRGNLVFSPSSAPLPVKVGLYLEPESRTRRVEWGRLGTKFYADLGPALQPNALAALGIVFREVVPVENLSSLPAGVTRVVKLSLGPGCRLKGGTFSGSEHQATTQIVCVVTDRDGQQLTRLEVEETRGDRDMSMGDALETATNDSLRAALDTLGLRILGARDVFEKMP